MCLSCRTSSELVAGIDWIKYVSFHKYSTEVLVVNEYTGLTFECEDGGTPGTGFTLAYSNPSTLYTCTQKAFQLRLTTWLFCRHAL